jgi:hypothetical protein
MSRGPRPVLGGPAVVRLPPQCWACCFGPGTARAARRQHWRTSRLLLHPWKSRKHDRSRAGFDSSPIIDGGCGCYRNPAVPSTRTTEDAEIRRVSF